MLKNVRCAAAAARCDDDDNDCFFSLDMNLPFLENHHFFGLQNDPATHKTQNNKSHRRRPFPFPDSMRSESRVSCDEKKEKNKIKEKTVPRSFQPQGKVFLNFDFV